MLQQISSPEVPANPNGSGVLERGAQALSPVEFYWQTIESAGGSLTDAITAISPDDSLRFISGIRTEYLEHTGEAPLPKTAAVALAGRQIMAALPGSSQNVSSNGNGNMNGSGVNDERTGLWESAIRISELYAKAEGIIENIDAATADIDEALHNVDELTDYLSERAAKKLRLSERNIEDLDLMSQGTDHRVHAEIRQIRPEDAKNLRNHTRRKIGPYQQPQAIRIAIEQGIIPIEIPSEKPELGLTEIDYQVLDLYSRGRYSAEIAKEIEGSEETEDTINSRLGYLVNKIGAANRQNLVRRAFELGALQPDENEILQLRRCSAHLSAMRSNLSEVRSHLSVYLSTAHLIRGGANFRPADNQPSPPQPKNHGPKESNKNTISVASRVWEVIEKVEKTLERSTKSIYGLLEDSYEVTDLVPGLLDEGEINELIFASEGVRTTERKGISGDTMSKRRLGAIAKLGANSLSHAVAKAINAGVLPVLWSRPHSQKDVPGSKTRQLIKLFSTGESDQEIIEAMGFSNINSTNKYRKRAREILSASDRASTVRRAFEEGVLIMEGPNGELQQALRLSHRSRSAAKPVKESLLSIDPADLNIAAANLEEEHLKELEWLSNGGMPEQKVSGNSTPESARTYRRRVNIMRSLGAKTIEHAVALAIERYILPITWPEDGKRTISMSKEKGTRPLERIARGATTADMAKRKIIAPGTITLRIAEIKDRLHAKTKAHAVRRGYETGILKIR